MLRLRDTTATVAEMASQTDDVTVASKSGRLRWTQLQETVEAREIDLVATKQPCIKEDYAEEVPKLVNS